MADLARLTGWSRAYLLWELPYGSGLGLIHSDGIFHGSTMKLVAGGAVERGEKSGLRDIFKKMRQDAGFDGEGT